MPLPLRNRAALAWALYDFGNSAFVLLVAGVAYPVYFKTVVFAHAPGSADAWWGAAVAGSALGAAVLSPFFGAVADRQGLRKAFLAAFTLAAVAFTAALGLAGPDRVLWGVGCFVAAHFAYTLALTFYDAALRSLASGRGADRLSGFGWGLGFAGGVACWALTLPLFGRAPGSAAYRWGFPAVALFYLVFALPALVLLPAGPRGVGGGLVETARGAHAELRGTLRRWRERRPVFTFLLGFWCVMQAISTVIYFTANTLATGYGLSTGEILLFTVLVQGIGFPATWGAGALAARWGRQRVILATLAVWAVVIGGMALRPPSEGLAVLAGLLGLVIGSTQAVGRSLLASLVEVERAGEFFGFNSLTGKAAATVGVLLFGAVSSATGSQAAAWALLLPFLAVGAFLLSRVEEPAEP
jgi:UMF1 family MFS transporter